MTAPGPSAGQGEAELPAWRRWSGVAIVGVLAVTLVVQSLDLGGAEPAISSTTFGASFPTPVGSAAPRAEPERDLVLSAVGNALSAWGEFAETGDITRLEGTFDPDGLQYAQLVEEAEAMVGNPSDASYDVSLMNPRVVISGGQATVSGEVSFSPVGQTDQIFAWNIDMVKVDGRWLLAAVDSSE